jgi:predicted alpha/beta hydrolase family esterase
MEAKELVKIMQEHIAAAKNSGLVSFTIESIEKWVSDDLTKLSDKPSQSAAEKEHHKNVTIQAWLEEFKGYQLQNVEMLKAVFQFGGAALKSAILINGGAAVALLAFMGAIFVGKPDVSKELTCPLMTFTFGVLSAAIASGTSYFAQYYYSSKNDSAGNFWRGTVIIFVFFSYILFAAGIVFTGNIFS